MRFLALNLVFEILDAPLLDAPEKERLRIMRTFLAEIWKAGMRQATKISKHCRILTFADENRSFSTDSYMLNLLNSADTRSDFNISC